MPPKSTQVILFADLLEKIAMTMFTRRTPRRTVALACVLLVASFPAGAHHAGTMFDPVRRVTLEGTVRQFQWANPHCYIQLRVPGASGGEVEWSIETTAPLHLAGLGWTPRTLRPGDRIRVVIAPLRNGDRGGEVREVTWLDGRSVMEPRR